MGTTGTEFRCKNTEEDGGEGGGVRENKIRSKFSSRDLLAEIVQCLGEAIARCKLYYQLHGNHLRSMEPVGALQVRPGRVPVAYKQGYT